MVLTSLQRATLYTLAYTSQFDYPLTSKEVWYRLITQLDSRHRLLTRRPTLQQVTQALDTLRQRKLTQKQGSWWTLNGTRDLITIRHHRFLVDQNKWQEVVSAVQILKRIPWIEAIFITGSLAMDNADIEEDIDFMIITSLDRLWVTRLVVSLIAWLKGKRRSWHGEEKRSWCFNLWLEADQLSLFKQHASLYTAYELIQARPVFDRHNIGQQLLINNPWVQSYLPLAAPFKKKWSVTSNPAITSATRSPFSNIADILNEISFSFQHWYMKSHMTRETVTKKYALFHPRDTQGWLYGRWKKVLEDLL